MKPYWQSCSMPKSEGAGADLYQKELLAHNRSPQNFRKIDQPSHMARAVNSQCGDEVTLYLLVEDGKVKGASFQGQSCAVCKSSASVLTTQLEGRPLDELGAMAEQFETFVGSWQLGDIDPAFHMFSALKGFPTRKKCLLLPWQALTKALIKGVNCGN